MEIFKKIFTIFILTLPTFLNAGSKEDIPYSFVGVQLFNFIIFVSILVYLIIKKVPQILKQKYDDYVSMNLRAQTLFKEACAEREVIEKKIQKLEKRKASFKEEIQEEVKRMERSLDLKMKEQCLSIIRAAQSVADYEFLRKKIELQNSLLIKIETLCIEICEKQKEINLLD